ncbi:hypothetical protein DCS_05404 [Drechmeria coniospora]|uniref:Major facilitator superfamily (MFS) profile domain-containing protein n=1 Tax=Drechmeria coniospora TaxID=98403 RepID=A0A151GMR5_DRECN|nr:hypothetical protein DCS_05404 [Drechmeria coniospora]KYK58390.1 hypothetical protein DCS_05404 [Drechmeria coniospora]ODA83754.1 hypothetical protein RJ55_02270 [Drechmeria coniospora]
MDGSRAPLMTGESQGDHVQHDDDDLLSTALGGKAHGARPGAFVFALTFAAGISGLLFGYDTGVISATLVSVGDSLSNRPLTSLDKSIITSSTSLFALVASPLSSVLADKLGRKHVMLYADVLFVAGALLQAFCSTVPLMVAGRCIVGAGVGAASFVVPLYIAELAPAAYRGRLVTTIVLFVTMGQMIAYITGWLFSSFAHEKTGWRWMVGLGALPAMLQAAVLVSMPETPRWLVMVGRPAAARLVVEKVHGDDASAADDAAVIVRNIEFEAREEREARRLRATDGVGSWKWLGAWQELMREGKNRRALAIACLLQGLQQLCGFNSLMYFSATIFMLVGFSSPTLTSLVVAVTNFVFTLAALGLIDRVGRRRILLCSIPLMIVGLLSASIGFSYLSFSPDAPSNSDHRIAASIVLTSIMLYVASFALGLGNVPWMQSELFPLSVRSLGSGIATATNWSANFVIGLTFLPLMDALSPSWTFLLYAVICGAGYLLVWRIYPETAGLSLEEATELLENGWGVK